MAAWNILTVFTFCWAGIGVVKAGKYCYVHGSDIEYCSWGCCYGNDYSDTYCCEDTSVGSIVGGVIGGLVLLGIIIGVIVAICCCMKRSQGRRGMVYQNNQGGTTVVTAHQAYGVPVQQPMYGAPGIQTTVLHPGTTAPYPTQMQAGANMAYPPNSYAAPPPAYDSLRPQ